MIVANYLAHIITRKLKGDYYNNLSNTYKHIYNVAHMRSKVIYRYNYIYSKWDKK